MAVFARGNVVVSKKNWIKKGRYKSVRAKSKSVQSVLFHGGNGDHTVFFVLTKKKLS
jgi:hypothetical protein